MPRKTTIQQLSVFLIVLSQAWFTSAAFARKSWTPQLQCQASPALPSTTEGRASRNSWYAIKGIAAGADGSILALFLIDRSAAYVVKFRSNGKLDKNFGSEGIARVFPEGQYFYEALLHVAADGQIYVGGQANTEKHPSAGSFLNRLTKEGKLDKPFNPAFPDNVLPTNLYGSVSSILTRKDGAIFVADNLSHIFSFDQKGQLRPNWNDKGTLTLAVPPPPATGNIIADVIAVNRLLSYPDAYLSGFHIFGTYYQVRKNNSMPLESGMMGCIAQNGGTCFRYAQRYSDLKFYIPGGHYLSGPYVQGPMSASGGDYFLSGYKMVDAKPELAVARLDWNQFLSGKFGDNGIATSSFKNESGYYHSEYAGADYSLSLDEHVSVSVTPDFGNFQVWKIKGDGTPVDGFGDAGNVIVPIPEDILGALAEYVTLADDGSVLTAGRCGTKYTEADACVIKIRPNGKLDETFNGYGLIAAGGVFSLLALPAPKHLDSGIDAMACKERLPKLITGILQNGASLPDAP